MNLFNFDGVLQSGNLKDTYAFTLDEQTDVEINGTSFTATENLEPIFDSTIVDSPTLSVPLFTPAYRVRFRIALDLDGDDRIDIGEVIDEPSVLPSGTAIDPVTTFAGNLDAGDYLIELTPTGTLGGAISDPAFSISYEINGQNADIIAPVPFTNSNGSDNTLSVDNLSSDSPLIQLTEEDNPLDFINLSAGGSTPTFADIDADGDFDAFIGDNNGNITYFQNDGEGNFSLADNAENPFNGLGVSLVSAPAFADIDADDDLDAFIGSRDGIDYFENDGEGNFIDVPSSENPLDILNRNGAIDLKPTFADIDADNDLDAFVGLGSGAIASFENDGEGNFVELTGDDNPFDDVSLSADSAPTFADIDGDGDLDALIGSSSGGLSYFQNDGEGNFEAAIGEDDIFSDLDVGRGSTPTFINLDGDRIVELVVGESSGTINVFQSALLTAEDLVFAEDSVGL